MCAAKSKDIQTNSTAGIGVDSRLKNASGDSVPGRRSGRASSRSHGSLSSSGFKKSWWSKKCLVLGLALVGCIVAIFVVLFQLKSTDQADTKSSLIDERLFLIPDKITYQTNHQLNSLLRSINSECPQQTEIITLGASHQGQQILGIQFSDPSASTKERIRIALLANMHGNEATGREILIWLTQYLCRNIEDRLTARLLKSIQLTVVPTLNPDGFAVRQEYSVKDTERRKYNHWTVGRYAMDPDSKQLSIDLNRDFPDATSAYHDNHKVAFNRTYFDSSEFSDNYEQASGSVESKLIQKFFNDNDFDFAINYHDGAKVVSYPLDLSSEGPDGSKVYAPSPDDSLYRRLSAAYANHWTDKSSQCAREFTTGTTNGAHWYSLSGGMQDFSYLKHGTMHVTIEVSCIKYPTSRVLSGHVSANASPLLGTLLDFQTGSYPKVYGRNNYGISHQNRIEFKSLTDNEMYSIVPHEDGSFSKILPRQGKYNLYLDGVLVREMNVNTAATEIML